jgi:hypothetical protein
MAKNDIRLGQQIIHEDDLKFEVEYNGEVFILKYPTPFEKAGIEADISRKLGGYARDTYPADHLALVEATSYADNLVVREESPEWFKSAWTCYDEACIGALYTAYLRFRSDFQAKLRSGGFKDNSKG